MKILLLARSTLYTQPGGDTLQIEQTAQYLQKLGADAQIELAGKKPNLGEFDLVHFFNLFRPADLLPHISQVKRLVVSSIYVDYSEYDRYHRGSFWKAFFQTFGKHGIEYLKTTARWLRGTEGFPGWSYLINGQKRSISKILQKADHIITASSFEQSSIQRDFPAINSQKFRKISLGTEHFHPLHGGQRENKVACVARIEGLKNQINLVKAMQGLPIELHLYGKAAQNQLGYLEICKKMATENVVLKGEVTHGELARLLPAYKVHAMPSYFETTGLSSLEALKAGCQIVVSDRGSQREIFGDHAIYCEPSSPHSIRQAIEEALEKDHDHQNWVQQNFSWQKAAREILDIYQKLINQS